MIFKRPLVPASDPETESDIRSRPLTPIRKEPTPPVQFMGRSHLGESKVLELRDCAQHFVVAGIEGLMLEAALTAPLRAWRRFRPRLAPTTVKNHTVEHLLQCTHYYSATLSSCIEQRVSRAILRYVSLIAMLHK